MNTERAWFGFFIVLALTLNFGFVMGELDNPLHHHKWELGAAFIVSLIATILKFGDRSELGSIFLATSLVADFHMAIAIAIWTWHSVTVGGQPDPSTMASIVSMAGGAMLANFASVALLLYETISIRRR
ncbi:DUF6394 family protein [Ostreibacterium oceani]|uniref:Uncharacterized protein n=1 Tax=Ostreibacterium oceani TaxID=2654998 RepID=A0A6N7ERP7_9GAMM|nr:DUF6394 family protein [Ostreibacterium oceani]MPV85162.1 hypothetical protein [Ostreibacterium oceani]